MIVLGVDIGSTSIKALLHDGAAERVLSVHSRMLDSRVTADSPHYYEEDPLRLRELAFEVIHEAACQAISLGVTINRIAITGQMHGGLFVDRKLNPLTNCITWQDKRCDERGDGRRLIDEMRDLVSDNIWEETGGQIFTGFLGATINWFVRKNLVPAHTAKIIGIYDWLTSELCGRAVTDPSSASAWGLYSIKSMAWQTQIVSALQVNPEWLPEVIASGEVIGTINKRLAIELGLNESVDVVSGLGDTQASFIGSGCRQDEILVNFGTGSQAMWQRDEFVRFPETDTRYLSEGKFLITVPTLSGGQAYALLADFIGETVKEFSGVELKRAQIYAMMNQAALADDEAAGLNVIPFFNGSRTKGEELRASISGISRENFHIKNLIRATLEGMVEEIAAPYLALPPEERAHAGIVASGNGIRRNPALRVIAEKKFGLPIRLSPFEEEAALGAALLVNRIR